MYVAGETVPVGRPAPSCQRTARLTTPPWATQSKIATTEDTEDAEEHAGLPPCPPCPPWWRGLPRRGDGFALTRQPEPGRRRLSRRALVREHHGLRRRDGLGGDARIGLERHEVRL